MRVLSSLWSPRPLVALFPEHHRAVGLRAPVASRPWRSARSLKLHRVHNNQSDECNRTDAANEDATAAILSIAVPTLVALAVDPVAGLLDTAFIGHLGSAELAGAGVSLSFFATTTKLINVPLLAVATSAVGTAAGGSGDADEVGRTAASVLAAATAVGIIEVLLLSTVTEAGLQAWGLEVSSAAYLAGHDYLEVRTWGAPVTALLLVSQGVFRGLGDARIPLRAAILACTINAFLDPLLMFTFGLGVRGAAYATVAGEGAACAFLIYKLVGVYDLTKFDDSLKRDMLNLIRPTGFLMLRTGTLSGSLAYATAVSARISVEATASFEICFQIWLASSLLADALAVAVQTVLARSLGTKTATDVSAIIDRSLQLGALLGFGLGGMLIVVRDPLLQLFSDQEMVLQLASQSLLYAACTQPLACVAFVWDGVLFGANAFWYAALAMPCCIMLPCWIMHGALLSDCNAQDKMAYIWLALAILMGLRSVAAYVPYRLKIGPFQGAKFNRLATDTFRNVENER